MSIAMSRCREDHIREFMQSNWSLFAQNAPVSSTSSTAMASLARASFVISEALLPSLPERKTSAESSSDEDYVNVDEESESFGSDSAFRVSKVCLARICASYLEAIIALSDVQVSSQNVGGANHVRCRAASRTSNRGVPTLESDSDGSSSSLDLLMASMQNFMPAAVNSEAPQGKKPAPRAAPKRALPKTSRKNNSVALAEGHDSSSAAGVFESVGLIPTSAEELEAMLQSVCRPYLTLLFRQFQVLV